MNEGKLFVLNEYNGAFVVPPGERAEDFLAGVKWISKGRYLLLKCIGEYDVEVYPKREIIKATSD